MTKVTTASAKSVFWECWHQGLSVLECSTRAGFSLRTGNRLARAAGVARRAGAPVKNPEAVAAMIGLIQEGVSPSRAARQYGLHDTQGRYWARRLEAGFPVPVSVSPAAPKLGWQGDGVEIDMEAPPGLRLSAKERQDIALGKAGGLSVTDIAKSIRRPKSTVSRELARNTDKDGVYRFLQAEQAARNRATRPKPAKLADTSHPLFRYVADGLKAKHSPEQIVHRLMLEYPDDKEMHVCAETIYQAIYVHAKGQLKLEVEKALRRGGADRKKRNTDQERTARIKDMTSISQRPAEVEHRDIPGHWEGDLILGSVKSNSAVATIVERVLLFTLLAGLPNGHTAAQTEEALVPLFASLPEQLCRSLTWDQGTEMANHLNITERTNIQVFFADPHSPWQRGTNENTNGLLRQYLPKSTDLSIYSPENLAEIAASLNSRPRKTLGWLTPAEAMAIWLGGTVIIGGRVMQLPDNIKALADCCDDR